MPRSLRIAIVGAGFGGVAAAHALQQEGQDDFLILERGDRAGGVWRANTYPGLACDVPSHVYSLWFAPNPRWTRRFSPGEEIQAYLRDVMRRFDLDKHLRANADVVRATFDDAAVERMTIFQRSAPWILPKLDTEYSSADRRCDSRLPARMQTRAPE